MSLDKAAYLQFKVQWNYKWIHIGDEFFIYHAQVNNQNWMIRLNEFPVEPHYTLIIDNEEIIDFDDWPTNWLKLGAFLNHG
jgi:hypothetical protein